MSIKNRKKRNTFGFTLIELLVVISIIGILLALSIFGMQSARQAARDGKRKSDLEQIRSGLEIYRADCGVYPTGSLVAGATLFGDGSTDSCSLTNTYISSIPADPLSDTNLYAYSSDGSTYLVCAALEQPPTTPMDITGCGNCGSTCNYVVTNP